MVGSRISARDGTQERVVGHLVEVIDENSRADHTENHYGEYPRPLEKNSTILHLSFFLSFSKTVEIRTKQGGVRVIVMNELMSDETYVVFQWRYQVHNTKKFPRLRQYLVFIRHGDDTLSKSIMV